MFYFAFQVEQNRMKLLNDKAVAIPAAEKAWAASLLN